MEAYAPRELTRCRRVLPWPGRLRRKTRTRCPCPALSPARPPLFHRSRRPVTQPASPSSHASSSSGLLRACRGAQARLRLTCTTQQLRTRVARYTISKDTTDVSTPPAPPPPRPHPPLLAHRPTRRLAQRSSPTPCRSNRCEQQAVASGEGHAIVAPPVRRAEGEGRRLYSGIASSADAHRPSPAPCHPQLHYTPLLPASAAELRCCFPSVRRLPAHPLFAAPVWAAAAPSMSHRSASSGACG